MNQAHLIGNLGKDIDLAYSNSGTAYARVTLATTDYVGKGEKETVWHNLVMFNKTAENAAEYLRKGNKVAVSGRISNKKYVDEKTKQTKYYSEIVVNSMEYLVTDRTKGASASSSNDELPAPDDLDLDDHPF